MPDLCDSPGCTNSLLDHGLQRGATGYAFCEECRRLHSHRVLLTQVYHEESIVDVILAASKFKTASGMADYIGVSFVTIYHWIRRYYHCTFQEFRRAFICKKRGENCYLLDITRSSYSRHDYVLKKIRSKRYCACINALEDNFIMTNAPISVVQSILRGRPRISQISDGMFALVPTPIYFSRIKKPVYFDVSVAEVELPERRSVFPVKEVSSGLVRRKRVSFRQRVFAALHRLGGRAKVANLVESLRTVDGNIPRVNNTRREVYRNEGLLAFDSQDSQVMCLTDAGEKEAVSLLVDL